MEDELYNHIYSELVTKITPSSPEEILFLHEIATLAHRGVQKYTGELEEAVGHLQETVKRLSKVDS